jgi:hypothetical protein
LAIEAVESRSLAVVEEIGDDVGNVVLLDACGDVLAISTTVDSHVVGEDASFGDRFGGVGEIQVPGYVWGGVVGTMEVVVEDYGIFVGQGTILERCCEDCGQDGRENKNSIHDDSIR